MYPFSPKAYRVIIPVGREGDFRFDCFVQPPVSEKSRPFKTDVTIIYQFGSEPLLHKHIIKHVEFQYNDGKILPYNY